VPDPTDARRRYAPYGLETRPEARGLTRQEVATRHGAAVVHHAGLPARPGDDGDGDEGAGAGAGVTVLLHGAAGSWTTWTPYLRAADETGLPVARPVLVDLPGWGDSPEPAVALDVEAAVDVVLEVADALGVDRFDLVGHSMGALVALHLAARVPTRVTRLGLVSPTSFAALEATDRPLTGLVRLPALVLLRAVFAVLPRASSRLLRGATRLGLLRPLSSPVFRHVGRVPRSVLEAFVAEIRPRGFVAATRSAHGYDTAAWSRVTCPVAAVAGADDAFAERRDLARLRLVLPDARTTLLPRCGHFAHVEWPFATVDALAPTEPDRAVAVGGEARA